MMPAENQEVHYDRIRRMVIAAFNDGAAPSSQTILADYETRQTKKLQRHTKQPPPNLTPQQRKEWQEWYKQNPEAFKVHAKETRPQGRSKLPVGRIDRDAQKMRARIRKLPADSQTIIEYFYNPNSIGRKHQVKLIAWVKIAPKLKGRNSETKSIAMMMLDVLLPCFKEKITKDRCYPSKIYSEFTQITPETWKKTYRKIWIEMESVLTELDNTALDLILNG